ncbi:MAG: beta-galactosidase [Bowdeniella nasicola]|nr:beta-galactosidase [Bowdeniella nasicola]
MTSPTQLPGDFGTFLAYGADYNPEQWPAETLAEDIALMQEAGVTMVTVGVFSWGLLEPEPGRYDFAWLDRVLDELAAGGIAVDLATATASPPVWMAREFPETLPVDAHGRRLGVGSRQQYCPSSPIFREFATRLAGALAQRYADHPALRLWHISNEYGCHVAQCHCAESTRDFQRWLRNRYGTIEALNDAWGTAFWSQHYTDFTQVHTPAAMPTFPNPGQVADFAAFSDDALRACYLAEKVAIREHSDKPITTNFMGLFEPTNYRRWAPEVDVVSDDSYPDPGTTTAARETAFVSDLSRSLRDGQPFLLMEQVTGMVQWRDRNARKRPGVFTLQSLQRVAHGADGIMQFQWRQSVRGAEAFHSAMVPHAGRDSRTWAEVVQLGRALGRLAPVVGARVDTPIGLLIDWESLWHRQAAVGPGPDRGIEAIRAWHATAFEAGWPVDFLFPDSDFSGYQVIVVPELYALSDALAKRLQAAADAGADVIVAAPSGICDETGKVATGGYGRSLRSLTGVRVADHHLPAGSAVAPLGPEVDPRTDAISAVISHPARVDEVVLEAVRGTPLDRALDRMARPRPALAGALWAEELLLDDGVTVWAEFAAGDLTAQPAITHRRCGQGAATYIATDLSSAGRSAIFQVAQARQRLTSPRAGMPAGVERVQRGAVTFLLNHADTAAQISGIVGTDLLTGQAVTGHIVVPARSAAAVQQ